MLLSFLLVIYFALANTFDTIASTQENSENLNLRTLYVGHPGSDREQDFVQFLQKHFAAVKTSDLAKFNGNQVKDFDIIILDYDGDGFDSPRPRLSRQYSRPTVTVGVTGARICDDMSLKTGYL